MFGDLTGSYVLLEAMRSPRRELNLARLAQRKDRVLSESGDGVLYMQRVHLFHSILASECSSCSMPRQMDGILWKGQDWRYRSSTFVSGYSRLDHAVNIFFKLDMFLPTRSKGFHGRATREQLSFWLRSRSHSQCSF